MSRLRVATLFVGCIACGCATNDGDGMPRRRGDGGEELRDAGPGVARDGGPAGTDAGVPAGTDAGPAPPPVDAGPPAVCAAGETRTCMLACGASGTSACTGGRFGPCTAGAETCNGADDDCNGTIDDGFACRAGTTDTCATACGSTGMRTCTAACALGTCVAPIETCNGRDDDCVGGVDDGALCAADESCRGGACARAVWVYEAEGAAMGHGIGRAEADGGSAATAPDARGYLAYGPYASEISAGARTASFRLMVDNNSADNGVVVRIEVNDFDGMAGTCGSCVLATRDIRRMEFTGVMAYQDFALGFTAPAGHRLELRTYWQDISYVRADRIEVR